MLKTLELELLNTVTGSRVTADGVELAGMVRSVRLDATAGERPHVILELVVNVTARAELSVVTYLAHLGPLGGAGTTRVEAVERLLDALREEDGVEPPQYATRAELDARMAQ